MRVPTRLLGCLVAAIAACLLSALNARADVISVFNAATPITVTQGQSVHLDLVLQLSPDIPKSGRIFSQQFSTGNVTIDPGNGDPARTFLIVGSPTITFIDFHFMETYTSAGTYHPQFSFSLSYVDTYLGFSFSTVPHTANGDGIGLVSVLSAAGPNPVPGPIVGSGLPGLLFGFAGVIGFWRWRRRAGGWPLSGRRA